jgi:hypothetical protein
VSERLLALRSACLRRSLIAFSFCLCSCPAAEDSLRTQKNACAALNTASIDQFPALKESLVYASAEKLFPLGNFASVNSDAAAQAYSTPKYTKPGLYEYVCTVGAGSHCTAGMYQQVIVKGGGPAV